MNEMARSARMRLLQRRSHLLGMVTRNVEAEQQLQQTVEPDWTDRAQDATTDTVLRELTDRERLEVQEIDAALQRIEAGVYGRCIQCAGPVGKSRLAAVPQARMCVSCEERAELAL